MRSFLFLSCLTLLFTHCTPRTGEGLLSSFTAAEIALIQEDVATVPMRILKTNIKEDSLLLRKMSKPVVIDTTDEKLQLMIDRLYSTVRDSLALGVGIAAPQVGVLSRIIWVQRFDKPEFPFEVYLNPKILSYSEEKQNCMEGCLSIPDKQADTKSRALKIQISYYTPKGKYIEEDVAEFTAVIFQHEIDHLNGKLFTDLL